ncbi:hypothetical protein LIX87_01370 [Weissella viridescens]|uniref:hypothetical protein n=1 Tax=Weissella viridescens TaxID=1629 RepID=UPI001D06E613|nr:hypothetical protein [Weissella viridescens]MCB6839666.1 hypothetical protein [Weissella viridescens]MCB6846398.1 hypothetical protein [Weissella viridescens]
MEDKTLLKYVYFVVALAVGFVLVTVIVDDNNEMDDLRQQASIQQSTIEQQRRELDRVEKVNAALVDQTNSKSGD